MNFRGLVITDAMNMKGVTKYYENGIAEAKALAAGNDVVEFVTDVNATIRETMKLIELKEISKADIDNKCRKILAAKYWAGLTKLRQIPEENLSKDLSDPSVKALIRDLYASSITVLNNEKEIIPVRDLDRIKIATLAINSDRITEFQKVLKNYHPSDAYVVETSDQEKSAELINELSGYDLIIAGIFRTDQRPYNNYGIDKYLNHFLEKLTENNRTIVVYFGNPYALNKLEALKKSEGLILAYQENSYTEDLSAQIIYGGIGGRGRLPVTINTGWPAGFGLNTPGGLRLEYAFPENAGLSSTILTRRIDSIANSGLNIKAYPGCEVMVARKGKVIFHKTYGFHTYENRTLCQQMTF
jgi:hypothetical protein